MSRLLSVFKSPIRQSSVEKLVSVRSAMCRSSFESNLCEKMEKVVEESVRRLIEETHIPAPDQANIIERLDTLTSSITPLLPHQSNFNEEWVRLTLLRLLDLYNPCSVSERLLVLLLPITKSLLGKFFFRV